MVSDTATAGSPRPDWPAEAARQCCEDSSWESRFRALVAGGLVRVRCAPATEFCLRAPALPAAAARGILRNIEAALGAGVSAGVDLTDVPPVSLPGWLDALAARACAVRGDDPERARPQLICSLPAAYPGLEAKLEPQPGEPDNFGIAVVCGHGGPVLRPPLQHALLRASYCGGRRYPVNSGFPAGIRTRGMPTACLPRSRFCAVPDTAWLVLELNLAEFGPPRKMRTQIGECLQFAHALAVSRAWCTPSLVTDAILHRRVAWVLTGLGQRLAARGYKPDDFATLRILRRWLCTVRRCIVQQSLRLNRRSLTVADLRTADRGMYGAPGFRDAVAGSHHLVASVDALLPDSVPTGRPVDAAWLNLFPALACLDALAAPGPVCRRLTYANWCRMVGLSLALPPG